VTNVHPAHIEGFGSLDAIADEKSDIYSAGARRPSSIVNACLLQYGVFLEKLPTDEVIVFSQEDNDTHLRGKKIKAQNVRADAHGRAQFLLNANNEQIEIALSVLGLHQVENALAAAGCALALGVSLPVIKEGLEAYLGEKGRMQIKAFADGTLVDDSYNANPASMRAAIDYLALQKNTSLLLGDMGELGKDAEIEHRAIGRYAKQRGISRLYAVGYFADDYADEFGEGAATFRTQEELVQALLESTSDDMTLLVKGSRSAKMDRICDMLELKVAGSNHSTTEERGIH
jgi:UDP-N-acetylmuramoyl-tripeptide--D-alanyl-D-alanine ligase